MSEDHGQGSLGRDAKGRLKLDHETREQWLDNDPALHARWQESGMTRDAFIEHHQHQIDELIATGRPS